VHRALNTEQYAITAAARDVRDEIEAFCRIPAADLTA
jgi:hypothetical protein